MGLRKVSPGMGKAEEMSSAIVKMTKDPEIMLDEKWKNKNKNKTPKLLSLEKKRRRDTKAYL